MARPRIYDWDTFLDGEVHGVDFDPQLSDYEVSHPATRFHHAFRAEAKKQGLAFRTARLPVAQEAGPALMRVVVQALPPGREFAPVFGRYARGETIALSVCGSCAGVHGQGECRYE